MIGAFVRLTAAISLIALIALTIARAPGADTSPDILGYARRARDHFDLFIYDPARDLTLNLTRTPLLDESAWDAVGGQVIVERAQPGAVDLCLLQTGRCLSPASRADEQPRFSPDGARLAHRVYGGGLAVRAPFDGAAVIYESPDVLFSDFVWSANGRWLLAWGVDRSRTERTAWRLVDSTSGARLPLPEHIARWLVERWALGSRTRPAVADALDLSGAVWALAPGGRQVAVTGLARREYGVWLIAPEGGQAEVVVTGREEITALSWLR